MPGDVGAVAHITVYGSWKSDCKDFSKSASVMKCSLAQNDFIYKYDDDGKYCLGFCGMH